MIKQKHESSYLRNMVTPTRLNTIAKGICCELVILFQAPEDQDLYESMVPATYVISAL
jgi:hypothetical protein